MPVHSIDPISDPRWKDLLDQHEYASVFHSPGWLRALQMTYGYRPVALTSSSVNQTICDGIVFCEVDSPLTGRRLVSVPFSDHCEPLLGDGSQLAEFYVHLREEQSQREWKYIELRSLSRKWHFDGFHEHQSYCFHEIDLTSDAGTLYRNLHKDCVQRKIRRAEREHLRFEQGTSQRLLDDFYALNLLTRRRHGSPPQPKQWFRNLVKYLLDCAAIHIAYKDRQPIAGIFTLRCKDAVVYKYAASNDKFNRCGGAQGLLWHVIQQAKHDGARLLDFGRSDPNNLGLVTFKDRWGARRRTLIYDRYPDGGKSTNDRWPSSKVQRLIARMPSSLFAASGRLLYRHIG